MIRIGFVQTRPRLGEVSRNVAAALWPAARARADLLVLPELFNTGYLLGSRRNVAAVAEPIPDGPTVKALAEFSRATGTYLVAGLAELEESHVRSRRTKAASTGTGTGADTGAGAGKRCIPRVYNSAVLIGPKGHIATYRKVHLFKNEKDWFDTGNGPFSVYDIGFVRVGLMICFDWIFPEAARTLALAGADIICHPANLVLPYCQDAMITRSIENRVFAVTANRVGAEGHGKARMVFTGKSQVTNPFGKRLVSAPVDEECVRTIAIDPRAARNKHVTPKNSVVTDRRPEMYRLG